MTAAEHAAKPLEKMPDFESAQIYRLKTLFGENAYTDILNGHFGILPAVKGIEVCLRVLLVGPEYMSYTPALIKLGESDTQIRVSANERGVFLGKNADRFGSLKTDLNKFALERLTEDERKKVLANPRSAPQLDRLPLHKGDWLLASGNSEAVDFYMREVDGDVARNYGMFKIDFGQNSVKHHIDKNNDIKTTTLIEIASQQIASVLGNSSQSPIIKQVDIHNLLHGKGIHVGAEDVECEFRIRRSGDNYNYELVFIKHEEVFLEAKISASLMKNDLLLRSIRLSK